MKKIITLLFLFSAHFVYADTFATPDVWTSKEIKDGITIQATINKDTYVLINCQRDVFYLDSMLSVDNKYYSLYWDGDELDSAFDFVIDQGRESRYDNVMDKLENARVLEVVYGSERQRINLPIKNLAKEIQNCKKHTGS